MAGLMASVIWHMSHLSYCPGVWKQFLIFPASLQQEKHSDRETEHRSWIRISGCGSVLLMYFCCWALYAAV